MENASKALIIAGAILLSILIIALGMFIFTNSSSTSDSITSTLSENDKQVFNDKFEKYKGSQKGSNVDKLVSIIRTNASTNKDEKDMIPEVEYKGTTASKGQADFEGITTYISGLNDITNTIEKSHMYTVELQYNDAGLVSKISISY